MQGKHPAAIAVELLDSTQAETPGWYWTKGKPCIRYEIPGNESKEYDYSGERNGPYGSAIEAFMVALSS